MEGYFITYWDRETFKRHETIDVADYGAARDIAKKKVDEGYGVSIWKGMRIFTTPE